MQRLRIDVGLLSRRFSLLAVCLRHDRQPDRHRALW